MKFPDHGVLTLFFLSAQFSFGAETGAGSNQVLFNRDIRPILSDRCFQCHGPDEQERKAHLRLDRAEGEDGAYRTRDGSTAIKPGSPDGSELWHRLITDDEDEVMPPPDAHKKPLTQRERELFSQWIEEGAEYETFWAFEPIARPADPDVDDARWNVHPIDRFVRRRLDQENLSPKPPADRRTLIRRLSLDLTGLPPTREEIAAFLADGKPGAYERLVDRLLAKPQFGEHVAKYWLDLVRFADTNGIHHDHFRDLSPYREWVIRSFNENLPYDEFVRYQLAGDLFPDATVDQLIASGFHRLHLVIDRGTMLPEESHVRNVIDRVTAVGTAFMGMTVQCAVCHDHKYDPFTSRDFFQLYAFLNNIDAEPETGGRSGNDFRRGLQIPYIELATPGQTEKRKELIALRSEAEAAVAEVRKGIQKIEAEEKAVLKELEETTGALERLEEGLPPDAAPGEKKEEEDPGEGEDPGTEAILSRLKETIARAAGVKKEMVQKELKDAEGERNRIREKIGALEVTIPAAMIMKERDEIRPAHLLIRGAYDNPGEEVQRGTPDFLPPMKTGEDGVTTRMDLANWFVGDEHPLTARVAVNRFWQQLFGVGIVKTSEDLGAQGEWPSHPDLLNYLAWKFLDNGWDVKALFREMVLSETYRQSSEASPAEFEKDPGNRLLARGSRHRLDSEVIRDQILATSGLLVTEMFGKSVKPPQPEGLWEAVNLPSSYPRIFKADTGEKSRRRSVYTFWKRGLPPPQMTILNAPTREECIARRERTNTPLQALLLMNEQEYMKAARHFAGKILREKPESRIAIAYETITSQLPDKAEKMVLQETLSDFESLYRQNPDLASSLTEGASLENGITSKDLAAWTMLINTLYNLDITKSRQ